MNEKKRGAAPRDRPVKVRAVAAKPLTAARSSPVRGANGGSGPSSTPAPTGKTKAAVVDNQGNVVRSLVGLLDASGFDTLECRGYTSLAQNPEVVTAVDTMARLVGSMTIHLMQNTPDGDVRVRDELSRLVDVEPNRNMTRSNFVKWIVRTMMLEGNGNAVVVPITSRGELRELQPIPPAYCAFYPSEIIGAYRIEIAGREYDPADVLHFVLNPGDLYPWMGQGYRLVLADVVNNLKQAQQTTKGFMSSKWKPSVIVKVGAVAKEFATKTGRKKLLQDYVDSSEAGEPWVLPADDISVEQIKPLSLSDLALADFVKLDKQTVAAILGIPSFVLGVGEFKADAWNNFVSTTVMPIAQGIQQELTRKLIQRPDEYFTFNPRSLMAYSLTELINGGVTMVEHLALRRNELRDWIGLAPDPEMRGLIALENYIPAERLGDQKKLTQAIAAALREVFFAKESGPPRASAPTEKTATPEREEGEENENL